MARRKPNGSDNRQTMDKFAYREETTTGAWERAVYDETTHGKLDAVLGALGGSVDTTVTIYNVNIINSNVEISQALPPNTKAFIIKSRNKGQVKLAYALGGTNTAYLTIPVGGSFEDTRFYQNVTLYFQTTKPGDIIEIVAYT